MEGEEEQQQYAPKTGANYWQKAIFAAILPHYRSYQ